MGNTILKQPSSVSDSALKIATRTEYVTMQDIALRTQGEKSGGKNFVDEYAKELTLAADLPVTYASDKFEDNGYFKEPWAYEKASNTTNISSGPTFYKLGAYKRKDIMGMRDSAIAYRKREFEAAGSLANLYRTEAIKDRIHMIALDNEHDMIYGDPRKNPETYLGLMPRHSMLTDQDGVILAGEYKGMMSPHITLDAGGRTEGKVFSIFLIVPSVSNGVYWIVPDDTLWSAGINLEEGESWNDVLVTESDGKQHVHSQKFDKFLLTGGVAIQDRRGCIRIANIDVSTKEGIENLNLAIDQAYEVLSPSQASAARLYIPRFAGSKIRSAYRGLVQPARYEDALPKNLGQDFSIDGHNFRPLFHLTDAESVVE